MGALNVLMAMGLFNVSGGSDREPYYEISSPIFDRITIQLDPRYCAGERFVIEVSNNRPENVYIRAVELNGEPLSKAWITHGQVIQGGTLHIALSDQPNYQWGNRAADLPSSMSAAE